MIRTDDLPHQLLELNRNDNGRKSVVVLMMMILWLVWKAHPAVITCVAFWLSVIWIIHSKNLFRHVAGMAVLLGVALNATVTELNGGVMPVVGMPMHFQPASPVWQAAHTSNHLLFLADNASLHFFSIGDLALIGGTAMFLLAKCSRKWAKLSICNNRTSQDTVTTQL